MWTVALTYSASLGHPHSLPTKSLVSLQNSWIISSVVSSNLKGFAFQFRQLHLKTGVSDA